MHWGIRQLWQKQQIQGKTIGKSKNFTPAAPVLLASLKITILHTIYLILDGEVSSDEDDLRYKINTLKAKRQRSASPERSGQVESDTFNDPDEIEPFMYERDTAEYDGYSGDMQEENLVPDEPRQVSDLTSYELGTLKLQGRDRRPIGGRNQPLVSAAKHINVKVP